MSIIATALKHLIAAGVTGNALVEAISEIEAASLETLRYVCGAAEPARSANAERQRRFRERKRESVTRNAETEGESVTRNAENYAPPSPDKENTPTPLKEINPYPREGEGAPAYAYTREAEPVTVDFEPVEPPAPGLPLGDEPPAKRKRGRPAKPKSLLRIDWEPGTMPPDLVDVVSAWPEGALASELAKFRDYWAGEGKAKADWDATWRNWLRSAAERRRGNGNGRANGDGHSGNGFSRATGGAFASAAFSALRDLE